MTEITYTEWMNLTKKRFYSRSAELKAVDKAFEAFELKKGTGGSLQELARVFKIWVDLKKKDGISITTLRNRNKDEDGDGPVDRLQSLIRTNKSSDVGIRRDLNGEIPDRLIMDTTLRAARMDSLKVRETYDRAKMSVHEARDVLLKAGTAGTAARLLYERWFGTFSVLRHSTVMRNYKGLCDLFDTGVIIIHDARAQMDAWGDCFGFAMPGRQKNYVEFTVGRAFFLKTGYNKIPGQTLQQRKQAVIGALAEAYKNTSDWTVGTMVHELGHATNALPDVDFQAPSTYQVSPGGLTPVGWTQCSTPDLDLALAIANADLAVLNTDNYGQCAREALAAAGR